MNTAHALTLLLLTASSPRTAPLDDRLRQDLLDRHAEVVARVCAMSDDLGETPAFLAAAAVLDFLASEPRLRLTAAPVGFTARHELPRREPGFAPGDTYVDHLLLPSGQFTFRMTRSEAPDVFTLLDAMNP
ncbi:MAG: hypothetical protein AB7O97_06930 [Planctomycetota bacterium]